MSKPVCYDEIGLSAKHSINHSSFIVNTNGGGGVCVHLKMKINLNFLFFFETKCQLRQRQKNQEPRNTPTLRGGRALGCDTLPCKKVATTDPHQEQPPRPTKPRTTPKPPRKQSPQSQTTYHHCHFHFHSSCTPRPRGNEFDNPHFDLL